jgi:hypothetical protein
LGEREAIASNGELTLKEAKGKLVQFLGADHHCMKRKRDNSFAKGSAQKNERFRINTYRNSCRVRQSRGEEADIRSNLSEIGKEFRVREACL